MSVISIQSQVVYGHVGNSAAVFPMQMHGIDVMAVPTTLLSNRPRYPTVRGRVLDPVLVADLLVGLEERGNSHAADSLIETARLNSASSEQLVWSRSSYSSALMNAPRKRAHKQGEHGDDSERDRDRIQRHRSELHNRLPHLRSDQNYGA